MDIVSQILRLFQSPPWATHTLSLRGVIHNSGIYTSRWCLSTTSGICTKFCVFCCSSISFAAAARARSLNYCGSTPASPPKKSSAEIRQVGRPFTTSPDLTSPSTWHHRAIVSSKPCLYATLYAMRNPASPFKHNAASRGLGAQLPKKGHSPAAPRFSPNLT